MRIEEGSGVFHLLVMPGMGHWINFGSDLHTKLSEGIRPLVLQRALEHVVVLAVPPEDLEALGPGLLHVREPVGGEEDATEDDAGRESARIRERRVQRHRAALGEAADDDPLRRDAVRLEAIYDRPQSYSRGLCLLQRATVAWRVARSPDRQALHVEPTSHTPAAIACHCLDGRAGKCISAAPGAGGRRQMLLYSARPPLLRVAQPVHPHDRAAVRPAGSFRVLAHATELAHCRDASPRRGQRHLALLALRCWA
mmetsp:Transcript_1999/g.5836  ORF Transcript_1999/g.5836 Transcript_1999/m.5836 type:complete len:254 (+) Transcript_1999:186-947(+)